MPAEATDNIKDFSAVLSLTRPSSGGRGSRPAVVAVPWRSLRYGEPGAAPRNESTEYAEVTRDKRFPGLRTWKTDNRLRQDIRLRAQHVAGWRFAYPAYKGCPRFGALFAPFVGPRKRSAAGQGQRARSRFCAGWRLRLTRPTKQGCPYSSGGMPQARACAAPPGCYCACCCACASWRTIASRRASPSGSRASNACRAATASG